MRNTPKAWDKRSTADTPWEAALWSEEGQSKRFRAIMGRLRLAPGDVLLDFGCGTGRLAEFLPHGVQYVGWDWSEKMRKRARREHPRGRILEEPPRFQVFDHVVCCGTFNLADNWSVEQTWEALQDLWHGQVVCSLVVSLYRGQDADCLRYSPEEALAFCRREEVHAFSVDATALDNDFLLSLYR